MGGGAEGAVVVGGAVRLALSLGLAQAVSGFLFDVQAIDPLMFTAVPATLGVVALAGRSGCS